MTPSEMREKLLELANWHDRYAISLSKDGWKRDSDSHKEYADSLRKVAETMKVESEKPFVEYNDEVSKMLWDIHGVEKDQ